MKIETSSERDTALREHLRDLLRGGDAHLHFSDVIGDFPSALINTRIGNLPYTPWHVLEHMRIAQWDILEFSRNENHVSPKFPEGYWPAATNEVDSGAWQKSVEAFLSDLREMEELVMNSSTDLFALIPHGDGQTILREALLVADHNSYHLGSLMTMKKAGLATD
jgi:hypothetical protein